MSVDRTGSGYQAHERIAPRNFVVPFMILAVIEAIGFWSAGAAFAVIGGPLAILALGVCMYLTVGVPAN